MGLRLIISFNACQSDVSSLFTLHWRKLKAPAVKVEKELLIAGACSLCLELLPNIGSNKIISIKSGMNWRKRWELNGMSRKKMT